MTNLETRLGGRWTRSMEVGMFGLIPTCYLALLVLMFCAFCAGCEAPMEFRNGEGLQRAPLVLPVFPVNDAAAEEQASPPTYDPSTSNVFPEEQALLLDVEDPELLQYMPEVLQTLDDVGFNVGIAAEGIPVRVVESNTLLAGHSAWATTHLEHGCYYGTCSASEALIQVDNAIFNRPDANSGYVRNSIVHEIGHVLSGLGECAPADLVMDPDHKHLPAGSANIMSNGNNGYAALTLTPLDLELMRSCLPSK